VEAEFFLVEVVAEEVAVAATAGREGTVAAV